MMDSINCTVTSEETVVCNGTLYETPEEMLTYKDNMFWVYIGIYTGLVIFAGLVSGLTMGLLSLDYTTLMTIKEGGMRKERHYASRILPLVKRHHLLLVTLLLSNAVAVEAMPIFLDRVSNPIIAIVISVTAVLIFGDSSESVDISITKPIHLHLNPVKSWCGSRRLVLIVNKEISALANLYYT